MQKREEPAIGIAQWRVDRSRNMNERIGLPARKERTDVSIDDNPEESAASLREPGYGHGV